MQDNKQLQINVDMNKISSLYPTLNAQKDKLMKIVGDQILSSIKINEAGDILVD